MRSISRLCLGNFGISKWGEAMAGRLEKFKEDSVILHEGKPNNHLYIVNSGSVVLYLNYGTPDEYIIGICGKNKIFGEESMLTGSPSRYTAVTFEECEIVWLDEKMLMSFFKDCPAMAMNLLKRFAKSNKMYSESLKRLVAETKETSGADGNKIINVAITKEPLELETTVEPYHASIAEQKLRRIESDIRNQSDFEILKKEAYKESVSSMHDLFTAKR